MNFEWNVSAKKKLSKNFLIGYPEATINYIDPAKAAALLLNNLSESKI